MPSIETSGNHPSIWSTSCQYLLGHVCKLPFLIIVNFYKLWSLDEQLSTPQALAGGSCGAVWSCAPAAYSQLLSYFWREIDAWYNPCFCSITLIVAAFTKGCSEIANGRTELSTKRACRRRRKSHATVSTWKNNPCFKQVWKLISLLFHLIMQLLTWKQMNYTDLYILVTVVSPHQDPCKEWSIINKHHELEWKTRQSN